MCVPVYFEDPLDTGKNKEKGLVTTVLEEINSSSSLNEKYRKPTTDNHLHTNNKTIKIINLRKY